MLKQLIDVKSNKIFVLQTAGKGTSCPACVWQTTDVYNTLLFPWIEYAAVNTM